jgi:serine phosphatase RsbU (regulator of sigma subunit)
MDFLRRFKDSLEPSSKTIFLDVEEYIHWTEDHTGDEFLADISDDVNIRTFLLDRKIAGDDQTTLERIRSSLASFHFWLKENTFITENPFEKYDLKWSSIPDSYIHSKHEAFPGEPGESEIARLRALNRLAEVTNQASDVKSMLEGTLETLLGEMELDSAWISLKFDQKFPGMKTVEPPAHGFFLGAAHNLPPILEQSDRYFLKRPPKCRCQELLSTGRLKHGVNVVECSRLQEAALAGNAPNELLFHASVPIISNDQTIGVMNFIAKDWQLLSASDLQFLTAGAKQVGNALERARLYDQIRFYNDHLIHEFDLARKVQISLMPEKLPDIPGYSLASHWQPAFETSGDYYNIFNLPANRWGIVVADVCDKGAPAALFMALSHGLIREHVRKETSPAALLAKVNRELYGQGIATNFITSFYAIFDPAHGSIQYSLAGHPAPLLKKASGEVEILPGKGMALGIFPDSKYEDFNLLLKQGDSLLVFTDGLTDADNPAGESFQMDNLRTALRTAPLPAQELVSHLRKTLENWVKDAPQSDDITLFVIENK